MKRFRVRSGRVLSVGTSVTIELKCVSFLACGCIHPKCTFWDLHGGVIIYAHLIINGVSSLSLLLRG